MIQIPDTKIAFHELNIKDDISRLVLSRLGLDADLSLVDTLKCDEDCETFFIWMPPFQRMVYNYEHLSDKFYDVKPSFAEFLNKAKEMKDRPNCPDCFKPQTGITVDHIIPFSSLEPFLKKNGIDFHIEIDCAKYQWAEDEITNLYYEDFYPFHRKSVEGMISVIIPAFNEGKNIGRCLDSIIGRFDNMEIIVVNDCSTDNTIEILKEYGVSVITNPRNLGLGASRLHGLQFAKGEYVSFIDADDYVSEDFYASLYECAKEHDADIVQANVVVIDGATRKTYGYEPQVLVGKDKIHKFFLKETMFHNSCLMRRSLFDAVRYSTNRYVEDVPTNMKLRYYANKVVYTGKGEYYYEMNPASLSHTSDDVKNAVYNAYSAMTITEFLNSKEEEYHIPLKIFFEMYKKLCDLKPSKYQLMEHSEIVAKLLSFAINNAE